MEFKQFMNGIHFIRTAIHKDIAFPQLVIYLIIAENEGITQPELANILKMPQGTVSRNVIKLGLNVLQNGDLWKQVGYDLVETRPDIDESRRLACYLTKRGKQNFEALKKAIK